jgi:hypothetical protein
VYYKPIKFLLEFKINITHLTIRGKSMKATKAEDRPGPSLRNVERQTYTIPEAAKILGICRALAYRKGVLPTVRIAGRRLVPKQALERMLSK